MVIALKILLSILLAACGLTIRFLYKEFKGVVSSTEYDESSIFNKFIIYLMAFGSIVLLLSILAFSGLLISCGITIALPW
jgi:ABC-type multidrug transport system permease subunit